VFLQELPEFICTFYAYQVTHVFREIYIHAHISKLQSAKHTGLTEKVNLSPCKVGTIFFVIAKLDLFSFFLLMDHIQIKCTVHPFSFDFTVLQIEFLLVSLCGSKHVRIG
jgi:hypothetical protein